LPLPRAADTDGTSEVRMSTPARTRFAPSPTGSLHVGGARTALFCLLHARRTGGQFLLRIEDTDQVRSTDDAAEGLLRDLRWLGLDWDEGPDRDGGRGPYYQSRRLAIYDRYVNDLLASGHAYEAWETSAELDAERKAAEAEKRRFRYVRVPYTEAQLAAFRAEGRAPVVRLAAPQHAIHVDDAILGPVTVAVDELEDIVIRKADGFPTYHFAVVIDDHLMEVTDILRGQEHLLNTPKHLGIYEALGWTAPRCGHMPLIFNPTGTKMSKRDKAKAAREAAKQALTTTPLLDLAARAGLDADRLAAFVNKTSDDLGVANAVAAALGVDLPMIEVMDFRRGGYLPEGLLNYLALLGWNPGDDREILTMAELTEAFSLDGVNNTAARFDGKKLEWVNAEHIRRASIDRLVGAMRDWLAVTPASRLGALPEATLRRVLALFQQRLTTLAGLEVQAGWLIDRPTAWDPKAVAQHVLKGDGRVVLDDLAAALAALPSWEAAAIDAAVAAIAEARGLGLGKVAQPLRVAITGAAVSPPIGDTLELVGRDESLARVDALRASLPAA
jgi:glutamyl/glutaminyl-tRNA synthetase